MQLKIVAAVSGAAVLALAPAATAFAAGSGYGPTVPTGPTGVPGGYTDIVTTQTVSSDGGMVHAPGVAGSSSVTLSVPKGSFTEPTQLEVTNPDLSAVSANLSTEGFSGYSAVSGVGVKALDSNGQPLVGTFDKPVSLTISGPHIGVPGEKVLELTGPHSATVLAATFGEDSVTIQLTADPDIAVVNPPLTAGGTAPGATTTATGKPFYGETLLAGFFITGGLVVLALGIRRRTSNA